MTAPLPECPTDVLDAVRAHVQSDTSREVGGFLVGSVINGTATIAGHIPALAAVGSAASLTFTHETWDEALDRLEAEFPGRALVGWYHSHPGHGVFLSEYDKFIQTNFFSVDGMPALVIDPLTGAEGWFQTAGGEAVEIARTKGTRPDPRGMPAATRSARTTPKVVAAAAGLAVAGILGYAVGFGAAGDNRPVPSRGVVTDPAGGGGGGGGTALATELASAKERIAELEAAAATNTSGGSGDGTRDAAGAAAGSGTVTVVYRVRPGDSLWRIAEALYGDGRSWPRLQGDNPGLDPSAIPIGQPVRVVLTPEAVR